MEWWLWLAGGLALVVAEVVAPSGFFILFFGLGALTVGVLVGLQLVGSLATELLLFMVSSVVFLLLFRGRLKSRLHTPSSNVDTLIGVLAIVQERLAPGVVGRVEVRGSSWSARNTSDVTLDPGQRARITTIDGLTLTVVPE